MIYFPSLQSPCCQGFECADFIFGRGVRHSSPHKKKGDALLIYKSLRRTNHNFELTDDKRMQYPCSTDSPNKPLDQCYITYALRKTLGGGGSLEQNYQRPKLEHRWRECRFEARRRKDYQIAGSKYEVGNIVGEMPLNALKCDALEKSLGGHHKHVE